MHKQRMVRIRFIDGVLSFWFQAEIGRVTVGRPVSGKITRMTMRAGLP
jgi:hypothetical protein